MIWVYSIGFSIGAEERQEFLGFTEADVLQPIEDFTSFMEEVKSVAHIGFQRVKMQEVIFITVAGFRVIERAEVTEVCCGTSSF